MALTSLPPIGFWSYARQDEQLSQGKLSELRTILMFELQQQYGRDQVQIFQDADTIPHGVSWEDEIRDALNKANFFIPVLTPNFIQSEWCCREVALFLEREATLLATYPGLPQRSRLFPIQYVDVDDVEPADPAVLAALERLQWFDFRRFRYRNYNDPDVREPLANYARSMRDLLKAKVSTSATDASVTGTTQPPAPPEDTATRLAAPEPSSPPAEASRPPTVPPTQPTAPPVPRQIEVGDTLNHMFEVKRFIKAGGMGQVYEGVSIQSGERVAIKALTPSLAADDKLVGMMQREAMTLTRLSHEALVQYRAMARDPVLGVLYIATEFIDGVDLGEALDRIDRSPASLARLLERLASGLGAAHRLGAIHRDMSPDNVMLPGGELNQAKIIDFGIAKDLGGHMPTLIGNSFAGKLSYVAPEQLGDHGGEIGPWTDIYSLALVILAAAKGEKADMAGSFADAIRKRREGVDLSAAPEELRPLLDVMLRPDPAERLRSMNEVLARLPGRAGTRSEPPPPPPPPPPPLPPTPPPTATETTATSRTSRVSETIAQMAREREAAAATGTFTGTGTGTAQAGGGTDPGTVAPPPRKQLSPGQTVGLIGGILGVLILILILAMPHKRGGQQPAPIPTPAPVPTPAPTPAPAPAPNYGPNQSEDFTWLERNWCMVGNPNQELRIRVVGNQVGVTAPPGSEQFEMIESSGENFARTRDASFAYVPGNNMLTIAANNAQIVYQPCQ